MAADVPNVAFVSSEGLADNGDNLHFNADGARELGRRSAAAYLKLTQRSTSCAPAGGVEFVCGLEAPEDLVALPGEEWVVASAYSGRGGIYLVRARDRVQSARLSDRSRRRTGSTRRRTEPHAPDHPTPRRKQSSRRTASAWWPAPTRCIGSSPSCMAAASRWRCSRWTRARPRRPSRGSGAPLRPKPIGLDSVRGLRDGGFITTNFLARAGGPDIKAVMAGQKNGELWEWRAASGWQKVPGTDAAGPNSTNVGGRTSAVCRGMGRPVRFPCDRADRAHRSAAGEVPLGFRVDNVRWARDGSLLAAGQGETPASSVVV